MPTITFVIPLIVLLSITLSPLSFLKRVLPFVKIYQ